MLKDQNKMGTKNCERYEMLPYLQATKLPKTISWILVKDMRPLC